MCVCVRVVVGVVEGGGSFCFVGKGRGGFIQRELI